MFDYIMEPNHLTKKLKNIFDHVVGAFLLFIENQRIRYPCVLLGEKYDNNRKETILLYRIIGKRHIYESSAKDLCNTKNLISKFHPLDVRIISFIFGVEQILEVPIKKRTLKFDELKKEIFKKLS